MPPFPTPLIQNHPTSNDIHIHITTKPTAYPFSQCSTRTSTISHLDLNSTNPSRPYDHHLHPSSAFACLRSFTCTESCLTTDKMQKHSHYGNKVTSSARYVTSTGPQRHSRLIRSHRTGFLSAPTWPKCLILEPAASRTPIISRALKRITCPTFSENTSYSPFPTIVRYRKHHRILDPIMRIVCARFFALKIQEWLGAMPS